MDEYGKRVISHYKIQDWALHTLMGVAQRLCPGGEWVFQIFATMDKEKPMFMAVVTNGDDNLTAVKSTPGAAVAQLIAYMLDGGVFPLTGNCGHKTYPGDNGWVKAPEDKGGE